MKTLQELLAQWETGTLNAREVAELKAQLARPEKRIELVEEWLLTESICHTLSARAAEAPASHPIPAQKQSASTREHRGFLSRWVVWREFQIPLRWALGFACAVCLVLSALYLRLQSGPVAEWVQTGPGLALVRSGRTVAAQPGQPLLAGDRIRTGPGNSAALGWNDGATQLEVRAGSELEIAKSALGGRRLLLKAGTIEASVAHQSRWSPLVVQTPQARAKVVGTRFTISTQPGSTRLDVLEGSVSLRKTVASEESEILVGAGQTALVAAGTRLHATLLTGFLSRELWLAPRNTPLAESAAKGKTILTPLAESAQTISNQVQRLRGYLSPPANGSYTFWLAAFDPTMDAELWLSTDESPARKRRVAFLEQAGNATEGALPRPRSSAIQWNRSPTQQSAPVELSAGKRYYIEVWHQGTRTDYLAIGWRRPGDPQNSTPAMLDVNALSPFVGKSGSPKTGENR